MKLFNIILFSMLFTFPALSQWESVGLYGGYKRCLIKDNSGRVLSGNAYGGIFRTSDVGKNWEQLFTGHRNEDVRSLAVNSNNNILAGTGNSGMFRSSDDGTNWATVNPVINLSDGIVWGFASAEKTAKEKLKSSACLIYEADSKLFFELLYSLKII